MKIQYLVVSIVSLFAVNAEAQIRKEGTRTILDPFQQVLVHDSVRHKLATFLWSIGKDSSGIMINHILSKDRSSQYRFVDGVYRFRLNRIPTMTYHFINTKNGGVQILNDLSIEGTLDAVLKSFKMTDPPLSSQEKLNCISTLLLDLKEREEMLKPGFHGDYEVRKKLK